MPEIMPDDLPPSSVLWIGKEPDIQLKGSLENLRMNLVPVSAELFPALAMKAEALILEIPPTPEPTTDLLRSTIEIALDHGLAIALAQHERANGNLELLSAYYVAADQLSNLSPTTIISGVRVNAFYREWARLAEWIFAHRIKRRANTSLLMEGDVPTRPSERILFQRTFNDFNQISLRLVTGGRSGAKIFLVSPLGSDLNRRPYPFIAKLDRLEKFGGELSNYHSCVLDKIPFRQRPHLYEERSVEGREFGLLAYDFIDRAIPFRSALRNSSPDRLIGSLFGHSLEGCLQDLHITEGIMAKPFEDLKALRWSEALVRNGTCLEDGPFPTGSI